MLTKPDDDTLTALARIGRSAEWDAIEAWLNRSREASIDASLSPDDVKCRQAQGAILVIGELLKNTRAAVESSTRR